MAIAAEFPDIDTLWSLRGPVEGFAHHRGITHTFVGIPVEAALLLGLFWLWDRWRRKPAAVPARSTPLRWGALYGLLLVALLSHILLDYTNNYGVRPFFPFNAHWFAASIVWIFDPLLFLLLVAGLLVPQLLRLVSQEQTGRRQPSGVLVPRLMLVLVVVLWGVRWFEHRSALQLASEQTLRAVSPQAASPGVVPDDAPPGPLLTPQRVWASPDPLSIFRWYTVADFGPAYRLGVAETSPGTLAQGQVRQKAVSSPTLQAALAAPLGRVYTDWSRLPWFTVTPAVANDRETTVVLQDLRFADGPALLQRSGVPPLTGTVTLNAQHQLLEQTMDGRVEPGSVP